MRRLEQAGQDDVAQRAGAPGEACAGLRQLRRREEMAERMIEGDPVAVGRHGTSLARSPL